MKTKKWMPLATLAAFLILASSCDEWGKQDPPAGNQIMPTLQNVAAFDFEAEEGLDPVFYQTTANPGGETPAIVADEEKGKVLGINNGFVSVTNPLNSVVLQNGVSFTFWVKDLNSTQSSDKVIALTGDGASLAISPYGDIAFSGDGSWTASANSAVKELMTPGEWHFVGAMLGDKGYQWWVDGEMIIDEPVADFDCSKLVAFANGAPVLTMGSADNAGSYYIDDLKVFRNQITAKECKRPEISGGGNASANPVAPIYFNSFDAGLNGCSIKGGGEIKYFGGVFGNVFSNAMDGMRQNYLVLPEDVLAHSVETQALTIAVWVNRGNETVSSHYMWSPLFTAYAAEPGAENGMPMLACQYRGVLQVNNNGWSDYTDVQNVNGQNTVLHDATDWLADGNWHHYAATFTPTTAKVYFDGNLINDWEIDGVNNTAAGLFSNGADLKHICLGGNQAWNWGDPDPGFWFDDIAIYNEELNQAQINTIIALKNRATYGNTFSNGAADATIKGGGQIIANDTKGFGNIFSNAMDGMRQNYLVLPQDALSHAADTEELSIAVWVNRGNETVSSHYMWSPLFTAYAAEPGAENGMPMLACQYRGVLQINNAGWSDYTDDQNLNGHNTVLHDATDWLADGNWHHYVAVFTPTTAQVYFDGNLINAWEIDGVNNTAAGLFTNGSDFKHICLGGNQAWNWGDPDPGFWLDDITIYNKALTQNEVQQLILLKK